MIPSWLSAARLVAMTLRYHTRVDMLVISHYNVLVVSELSEKTSRLVLSEKKMKEMLILLVYKSKLLPRRVLISMSNFVKA